MSEGPRPQEIPLTDEVINTPHWEKDHDAWLLFYSYFSDLLGRLIINEIPGDIVECGVGEGGSFEILAHILGFSGEAGRRKLWGFDSFEEGWPKPTEVDMTSPREPKKGEWARSETQWRERFEQSGIFEAFPDLEIEVTKGFLRDTLPSFVKDFPKGRKIAFVHLDVDLYEGYRDGLEHLYLLLAEGGIIALDEFLEFPERRPYSGEIEKWPGCTKAVDEFLAAHRGEVKLHKVQLGKRTKYYIVKIATNKKKK